VSAFHRVITLNRLECRKNEKERDKGVKDKSGERYSNAVEEKGKRRRRKRGENMMHC